MMVFESCLNSLDSICIQHARLSIQAYQLQSTAGNTAKITIVARLRAWHQVSNSFLIEIY
jgi:hypothetical protein